MLGVDINNKFFKLGELKHSKYKIESEFVCLGEPGVNPLTQIVGKIHKGYDVENFNTIEQAIDVFLGEKVTNLPIFGNVTSSRFLTDEWKKLLNIETPRNYHYDISTYNEYIFLYTSAMRQRESITYKRSIFTFRKDSLVTPISEIELDSKGIYEIDNHYYMTITGFDVIIYDIFTNEEFERITLKEKAKKYCMINDVFVYITITDELIYNKKIIHEKVLDITYNNTMIIVIFWSKIISYGFYENVLFELKIWEKEHKDYLFYNPNETFSSLTEKYLFIIGGSLTYILNASNGDIIKRENIDPLKNPLKLSDRIILNNEDINIIQY